MPIVIAQGGLIDEGYNAVRLARYAQLQQYECAFWGVLDPAEPVNQACSPILTLQERAQITRYLGEAQDEIEQVCGFPLSARWFTDELPFDFTVHARRRKVIEPGIEARENVAIATAVSYAADPSVVGPIATTVLDADEIHVFHHGTDIEIDPSDITIAGGFVTIQIPRCRLVDAAHADNPEAGLDYTDVPPSVTSPFEATVDVIRIYNDDETQATMIWPHQSSESSISGCTCGCVVCGDYTHEACMYVRNHETGAIDILYAHLIGSVWTATCPCVCSSPQLVRINYHAGLTELTLQAEDAIIRLAHAKMPRPACGCGMLRDRWDADRVVPDGLTAEQASCPFGQSVGAYTAYKFAQAMKIYRVGIL